MAVEEGKPLDPQRLPTWEKDAIEGVALVRFLYVPNPERLLEVHVMLDYEAFSNLAITLPFDMKGLEFKHSRVSKRVGGKNQCESPLNLFVDRIDEQDLSKVLRWRLGR